VLERDPTNMPAMLALEPLYRQQGPVEVADRAVRARVKGARSTMAPASRSLREVAHLYENQAMGDAEQLRGAPTAILQRRAERSGGPRQRSSAWRWPPVTSQLLTRVDAQLASGDDDPALIGAYYTRLGETLERAAAP
jgi:hypothetical protein